LSLSSSNVRKGALTYFPQKLDKLLPHPPDDLKKKHRWFQCTIKNATQFDLLLEESYLDSGTYWTAPGTVTQFDQMTFSGCNKNNSVATGVSGGQAFRVYLDEQHDFSFAIVRTGSTSKIYHLAPNN